MNKESTVQNWTVYTDGSACAKSQRAAIGVVLYKALDGEPVERVGKSIAYESSQTIEYRAVLLGLQQAYQRGARMVEIRSDSRTMVGQLNGQCKVNAARLKPLYEDVKKQTARFTQVTFLYVERAQNALADELARTALQSMQANEVSASNTSPKIEGIPTVAPTPIHPQQVWKPVANELCVWNLERLWVIASRSPLETVAISDLAVLLDAPGWFGDEPLTLRRVAELSYQTTNADLEKPLLLCDTELLDGRFRLANAVCQGRQEINVKRLKQLPKPDSRYPLRYAP